MSVGRFRRWALLFLVGWAGCGSPPARLTPATPESPTPISPTAAPTRTTAPTPTRTPTKQAPAAASPTARPTATKAQAFMPQPFPDGFQTEGNWIALQVDTYRQDGEQFTERERSDLWFTNGQRWLGPIPLRGGEAWHLQRAFRRRQGEAFELCATLETRSICIPTPPGISFSAPEPSSIRAEACRDKQAICVAGPDGSTREFRLPADLIENWQVQPLCVSRDRWVIVEVYERSEEGELGVPLPPLIYRLDMARGLYERVDDEQAQAERIRAFQRHGILPGWIYWAYNPVELEPEMCSPDTRFYLIHFQGGMGGSEDSVWILRVEDGALYPLPGPEARWVWPEPEGH